MKFRGKDVTPAAAGRLMAGKAKPVESEHYTTSNGDIIALNGDGEFDWLVNCKCGFRFFYTSRVTQDGKPGKFDELIYGPLPESMLTTCPNCGREIE